MARLPLDALQAMLIASIQALDVEKVQACLELGGERISRLDETHVYPAIWRAAHQAPGQDTEGRCQRNEIVAVILDKVCAAGLNPLSDNQLALASYVVDWSNYRPPWSGLTPGGAGGLPYASRWWLASRPVPERLIQLAGHPAVPARWRRNRLSGYVGSKSRPDYHQGRAL